MNPHSNDPTSSAEASNPNPTLLEQSAAPIEEEPAGRVELADTRATLAQSQAIPALLLEQFGAPKSAALLVLMTAGGLDGELGAELDNFLVDAIDNDSDVVWEGLIDGEYPVGIRDCHCVYHVWAMEHGRTGYVDLESAHEHIDDNWENVVTAWD